MTTALAPPRTEILDLGYRPRPQFVPFHKRRERWACLVAHRRAGKTVACVMDVLHKALKAPTPNSRYAYVAPFYSQAKDVVWDYVKRYAGQIRGCEINESELRVDVPALNGTLSRIRLYGADNYDRMRGIYLDGAVLDEYADWDPRAWSEVLRPALSDRKGWGVFIGTPKGSNGFREIWRTSRDSDAWFSLMLKASETGILDADELADARRTMSDDAYNQEYECSFDAAVVGSYYGRDLADLEAAKRITSVPYERAVSVSTSWDLGIDDATAVWFFQNVGREVRVIDHMEIADQDLVSTAKAVLAKPYVYDAHYMPHDIAIRELISGASRQSTLEGIGLKNIHVGVKCDPVERINAARILLPKCIFDRDKCAKGLEALKGYRREWDEKMKVYKSRPCHDWASHSADAFGEYAINFRQKAEALHTRRKPNIGTRV